MTVNSAVIPGEYTVTHPGEPPQTISVGEAYSFYDARPDRIRSRKPTGWLYPTAYFLTNVARRKPVGELQLYQGSRFVGHLPQMGGNHEYMNPLPGPDEDLAITKALLQLKDQRLNIGVALGEAQATANLVGDTAITLARSYQSLRKGDVRGALDFLGIKKHKGRLSPNSSKAWLQLQYGVKPFLSDVHGAVQHLAERAQESRYWRQTVKGSDRVKDSGSVVDGYYYPKRISYHRESGVFVRLDYTPGNTFLSSMGQLGITNPLSVAWELVPGSFVLDWLLPVGDYLSVLDADLGWKFHSGSISTFSKCRSTESATLGGYVTGGSFTGSHRRTVLYRKVLYDSPLPKSPSFKNPVSLGHMANGLALLTSVFSKK